MNNDSLQTRIHDLVVEQRSETAVVKDAVQEYRLQVCYALLLDNVKFSVLEYSQNPNRLRHFLEFQRGTLPERDVRDKIPDIQRLERENLLKELKETNVSVIFDATSEVCEIFGVAVRFISNESGQITQRAVALEFVKKSLTAEEQVQLLSNVLLYRYQINPSRIIAFIRDGCSTNNASLNLLKIISPSSLDITCIAHGCNIFGNTVKKNTPTLSRFVGHWSTLLTVSKQAMRKFRDLLPRGQSVAQISEVRWFTFFEVAAQLHLHWNLAMMVINDPASFAGDSRRYLKGIVDEEWYDLRKQLAIVVDKCESLCTLCHNLEGDGFLSPLAYDLWMKCMREFNSNDGAPALVGVLQELYPSDHEMQRYENDKIIEATLGAARIKLRNDESLRLREVLEILRACRLFNYEFIAKEQEETLLDPDVGEFKYLNKLPKHYSACSDFGEDYVGKELKQYVGMAKSYYERESIKQSTPDLWGFWLRHKLMLPLLYALSCDVALIVPSSCTVERIFSMYEQRFSSSQERALEDLKATGTILAYNTNFRDRKG